MREQVEGTRVRTVLDDLLALALPSDAPPAWLTAVMSVCAIVGASWATLPAAWKILTIAMFVDFITGMYAARRRKVFTIARAGDGFLRKGVIVCIVGGVYGVSSALGAGDYPGTLFGLGFALIDGMSSARNCRRARIELPPFVERVMTALKAQFDALANRTIDGK